MDRFYGTVPQDVPFAMVATRDIAARAAFLLMNPEFRSHNIEYVLGERDLTYEEIIPILAQTIKSPILNTLRSRLKI